MVENVENEIQIEATGPDFVVRSLEGFLTGAEYCDLQFICAGSQSFQAHCAVVSAVSDYVKDILRDARVKQDVIHVQLPDVSLRDVQSFLQLVYTGTVSVGQIHRGEFVQLLRLLEVNDSIEEYESPYNGNKYFVRKDRRPSTPTLPLPALIPLPQNFNSPDRSPSKSTTSRKSKRRKVVEEEEEEEEEEIVSIKEETEDDLVEVQVDFCNSQPLSPRLIGFDEEEVKKDVKSELIMSEPPAVESLLAHLEAENYRKESSAAEIAQADLTTKAWLQSSSVKVPQMTTNGEGELVLSHVEPTSPSTSSRKCERCRCPLCMDVNRVQTPGEPSLHLCHYPTCGKVYKKTSHLRAHLRWHIGDQPYPCSWPGCSKRFTRSDELHRHFRIHTGERRHKCAVCDKSFSRSDHLKKHMHSHHASESANGVAGAEIEIDPTQLLEVEQYGVDQ